MTITDHCDEQTSVPAEIIASLVAAVAGHNQKVDFFSAAAGTASCILESGHSGQHGTMLAVAEDDASISAWLRWWTATECSGDWLADCTHPHCLLFRGHGGDCDDFRNDSTDPEARTA